jgi:hypothetical protein
VHSISLSTGSTLRLSIPTAQRFKEQAASLLGYEGCCTLSGFDRLVFRGTLLPLMPDHAMFHFLTRAGVRLLDFKD